MITAACLVTVIVAFVSDRQLALPDITTRAWLAIFLSGAIGLSPSFVLFVRMIGRHGLTAAVLATYVMPVVAAVLGVIIVGETITPLMLAGSLFFWSVWWCSVRLASLAVARPPRRRTKARRDLPASGRAEFAEDVGNVALGRGHGDG